MACASPLFLFIFVYTRRVRGLNSHSQGLSHCQFFFLVLRLRRCCRGNRVFCSDAAPLPRLMMTTADNSIGSKVPCALVVNNPIKIQSFYLVLSQEKTPVKFTNTLSGSAAFVFVSTLVCLFMCARGLFSGEHYNISDVTVAHRILPGGEHKSKCHLLNTGARSRLFVFFCTFLCVFISQSKRYTQHSHTHKKLHNKRSIRARWKRSPSKNT